MCDFIKKVNVLTNLDSLSEFKPIFENFNYERNDVFREMMLDFIDFVKSDSDSVLVPLSRGLEVMLLVEKIRQSSQRKKWTKVGKL
jgi:predicted dehydrogenase